MSASIEVPVSHPTPLSVDTSLHYWHPNRFGVQYAPTTFRQELQRLHPDLDATWHPVRERWLVWYRRPRIQHHLCPGWLLLFIVETSDGRYGPLDARVFAVAYEQSGRKWGSGKAYWARVEEEAERDTAAVAQTRESHLEDIGSERWRHTQIQVSMRGHSNGSKFVNHHAGD